MLDVEGRISSTHLSGRVRQRAVPVRHEAHWGLHRSFRRSRHVRDNVSLRCDESYGRSSYFLWQDILQVIIPRYSALEAAAGKHGDHGQADGLITCPICLSTPSAPRMTKCGHVRRPPLSQCGIISHNPLRSSASLASSITSMSRSIRSVRFALTRSATGN